MSWVVFDAEAVTHADSTGLEALTTLANDLHHEGITLVVARLRTRMQEQFQLADVTKTIGAGNFYLSVRAADGLLDVRPMFAGLDGDRVVWNWHERERADAVILATGYRPSARLPPRAGRPGPWRRTAARRRDFHHPSE